MIQPVFQAKRIAQQAGVIAAEATSLVERLSRRQGAGPIDIMQELTGLTLGVLVVILLMAALAIVAWGAAGYMAHDIVAAWGSQAEGLRHRDHVERHGAGRDVLAVGAAQGPLGVLKAVAGDGDDPALARGHVPGGFPPRRPFARDPGRRRTWTFP